MQEYLTSDVDVWEEVINGRVEAMSPRPAWRHITVAGNIYRIFANHLWGKPCKPIPDGMDLYLTEKDRFVPDMMVVCEKEKMQKDGVHGAPTLVVEVLSPGSVRRDRGYKKDAYEAAGVKEYWIVDPLMQTIEVYQLEEGRYALNGIYARYRKEALEEMTEEEQTALATEFQCTLFGELNISLEDVFE